MRVLIAGAGIAGHTLALCLLRRGFQALVVEKAPSFPTGGYMMDFFGSGYDACERLGLMEELERIHYPIDRFVFLDARGGERFALPYSVLRKRLFGDHLFNFLRGDLVRVLNDRVRGSVEFRFGTRLRSGSHVRADARLPHRSLRARPGAERAARHERLLHAQRPRPADGGVSDTRMDGWRRSSSTGPSGCRSPCSTADPSGSSRRHMATWTG
jgi:2-polyprenyl-6-methoxyphenol hydroxylase-like FAD-dependent oxidoreductase